MKKLLLLCACACGAAYGMNETATPSDGQKKEAASAMVSTTQREQPRSSYERCKACDRIPRSPNAPLFCTKHLEMVKHALKQRK
jgi:hypothetical protein